MKIRIVVLLALIFLSGVLKSQDENNIGKITVNVRWEQAQENDTLYLFLSNPAYEGRTIRELKRGLNEGKFSFQVDVADSSGFFSIRKRRTFTDNGGKSRFDLLTRRQSWVIGDSVDFNFSYYKEAGNGSTNANFIVSGNGALKYNLAKEIDSILMFTSIVEPSNCEKLDILFKDPFNRQKYAALTYLKSFKNQLSETEYLTLKAGIDYFNGNLLFMRLYDCFKQKSQSDRNQFIQYYENHINNLVPKIPGNLDLINTRYVEFLFYRYINESKIRNDGEVDFSWLYKEIIKKEKGKIRDRLIARLMESVRKPKNFQVFLEDALTIVSEKYSRKWIETYRGQVEGQQLKDFVLLDTSDNLVNISKFKGKIVLIDFWAIGCGACSLLYQNVISKMKPQFEDNVIFISVGVDSKKDRWLQGIASGLFTDKDGINLSTGQLSMKHPAIVNNSITATPTAILLNSEGRIIKFNTEDLYTEKGMAEALKSVLTR